MHETQRWLAAMLAIGVFTGPASAQEAPPPVPIELWGCNFQQGSGMEALEAVIGRFNSWADENGITELASSMLTPLFRSPDDAFDVLFIDRWASGEALGAKHERQAGSRSFDEIDTAWNEVVDCPLHSYFAGLLVVPASAERRDEGPIQFQDCTVREGASNAEVLAGVRAFSENAGPKLGGFALYMPFMGQPREAAYDFKFVALFDSYQTMGNAFDLLFRGQGFQVAATTTAPVMQCDSARMYMQTSVRRMRNAE